MYELFKDINIDSDLFPFRAWIKMRNVMEHNSLMVFLNVFSFCDIILAYLTLHCDLYKIAI